MQETKKPRDPKKSLWVSYLVIFLIVILFNTLVFPMMLRAGVQQVDYGTFLQMLEDDELTTVQIDDEKIYFIDKENNSYETNAIAQDLKLVDRLEEAGVKFDKVINDPGPIDTILNIIIMFLPMILLVTWISFMMRKTVCGGGRHRYQVCGCGR